MNMTVTLGKINVWGTHDHLFTIDPPVNYGPVSSLSGAMDGLTNETIGLVSTDFNATDNTTLTVSNVTVSNGGGVNANAAAIGASGSAAVVAVVAIIFVVARRRKALAAKKVFLKKRSESFTTEGLRAKYASFSERVSSFVGGGDTRERSSTNPLLDEDQKEEEEDVEIFTPTISNAAKVWAGIEPDGYVPNPLAAPKHVPGITNNPLAAKDNNV
jgi:hypothetical protein